MRSVGWLLVKHLTLVTYTGRRQWDERRPFTLWERTELCQCNLECSLCFRSNSVESYSYSSQRTTLYCVFGILVDRFHVCSCRGSEHYPALRLPILVCLEKPSVTLLRRWICSSVGLFEAGHFPAVMYICSSYYKPHELARRNTIIQVFTSVGPLFSGFLMAAVYAGLNEVHGLAGWRWMYMLVCTTQPWYIKTDLSRVCGCISLPCALWTAVAMPQLPARAKANWSVSIFSMKHQYTNTYKGIH